MVQGHKCVTVYAVYDFDRHSRKLNIYLNIYFNFDAVESRQSAELSYVTQHAMPLEFSGKWGTAQKILGTFRLPCCIPHIQRGAS